MPQEITSQDTKNATKLAFGSSSITYVASATELKNGAALIYAIQPIGGDAVITSAKDINGAAVSALAGLTYSKDVVYVKQLQSIIFTSLTAVEIYYKNPQE